MGYSRTTEQTGGKGKDKSEKLWEISPCLTLVKEKNKPTLVLFSFLNISELTHLYAPNFIKIVHSDENDFNINC